MDLMSMAIAEATAQLLLVAAMLYLYRAHQSRYLGSWTLAWFLTVLYGCTFLLEGIPGLLSPTTKRACTSLGGLFLVASAASFFVGTSQFLGTALRRFWVAAIAITGIWAAAAPFITGSFTLQLVPTTTLMCCALVTAGKAILTHGQPRGFEAMVAGGALVAWGFHMLDYPFLAPIEWFAPFGFFLSYILQLSAAVAMILHFSRGYRERLVESERNLAQAQKTEALGRLAGGIAHDFNNMLTVIMGNLALVPDTKEGSPVDRALRATERSAELTRQLLRFCRRDVSRPQVFELSGAIQSAMLMMERLVGENVRLKVRLDEKAWVKLDPGHVEQILLNLAVNSRDAMPNGGVLSISLVQKHCGRIADLAGGHLPPGNFAVLSVRDTGTGMAPEVSSRVFDPFFTTKAEGEGTGLGLSTVRMLVQEANGTIGLESEPGQGTEFCVYLPIVARPGEDTEPAAPTRDWGNETVLLVEDNSGLRLTIEEGLTELGYRVIATGDSRRAAAMIEETSFDLILSDVVLTSGSGPDLARLAREHHPRCGVLLMSGYSAGRVESIPTTWEFISKPFTPSQLGQALRQALDTVRSSRGEPTPPANA